MRYAIDLFCGAGGMSEGILQAGFHILFSSDISEDVERTYKNRHKQLGYIQGYNTYFKRCDVREITGDKILKKIRALEIFSNKEFEFPSEIDAIFGGPPCQGFSRAGRRDPNDPRNLLFKEYLRVIKEVKPKYVVMENVEGFNDTKFYDFIGLSNNIYDGEVYAPKILKEELDKIGYNILEPKVLDASDYGVPQRRKRAIFIAYKKGLVPPKYPEPLYNEENKVTVLDAISDLTKLWNKTKDSSCDLTPYQLESRRGRTKKKNGEYPQYVQELKNVELSKHSDVIVQRFSLYNEGEDSSQLKRRILNNGIDLSNYPALVEECSKKLNISQEEVVSKFKNNEQDQEMVEALLTKKSIRTRLDRNKPSNTVVTLPDDYISPFENRMFTVREMARLQSFDDSFEFLGKRTTGGPRRKVEVPQYTQVGNAVPPLLAKAIAKEIMIALNKNK